MKSLEIVNIENFLYTLRSNDMEYSLSMEFFDIEEPVIGDILILHEELLNIPYLLSFGDLGSSYGRKIESNDDKDIMVLIHDGKRIYLKRLYG